MGRLEGLTSIFKNGYSVISLWRCLNKYAGQACLTVCTLHILRLERTAWLAKEYLTFISIGWEWRRVSIWFVSANPVLHTGQALWKRKPGRVKMGYCAFLFSLRNTTCWHLQLSCWTHTALRNPHPRQYASIDWTIFIYFHEFQTHLLTGSPTSALASFRLAATTRDSQAVTTPSDNARKFS